MSRRARAALLTALPLLGPVPAAADVQATIDNFSFSPAEIHIAAGERVIWTNRDDIPHTIADEQSPATIRSPALDTGDSYARRFAKPGAYRYFCSLHPRMQGIVIVR